MFALIQIKRQAGGGVLFEKIKGSAVPTNGRASGRHAGERGALPLAVCYCFSTTYFKKEKDSFDFIVSPPWGRNK